MLRIIGCAVALFASGAARVEVTTDERAVFKAVVAEFRAEPPPALVDRTYPAIGCMGIESVSTLSAPAGSDSAIADALRALVDANEVGLVPIREIDEIGAQAIPTKDVLGCETDLAAHWKRIQSRTKGGYIWISRVAFDADNKAVVYASVWKSPKESDGWLLELVRRDKWEIQRKTRLWSS